MLFPLGKKCNFSSSHRSQYPTALLFGRKRDFSKLTDAELIAQYKQSGNTELVGILFKRYSHMIGVLCFRFLKDEMKSEDAAMEIFERLLSDLKKHDVQVFRTWIYSVTKHHCLKMIRHSQREQKAETTFSDTFVELEEEDALLVATLKEQEIGLLEEGLAQLSKEQRLCVELFYLKGKRYKDIVEQTGYEQKKVKSYIQNGKRNLKIYLEKKYAR